MLGDLFLYNKELLLAAFENYLPNEKIDGTVIFIGGMSDGFMTCPIVENLAPHLAKENITVTQFIMTSSYRQFGTSSLGKDCEELCNLIESVQSTRGRSKIFLLGHSTGCQDILWYLTNGIKAGHLVYGANLQAPVSDRDFIFWHDKGRAEKALKSAEEFILTGNNEAILPEMFENVPMSAYRGHSLYSRLGDDDYFSLDLNVKECKEKFPGLPQNHPTFNSLNFSFSLNDEFVPNTTEISALVEKLVQCYPFTREPILLAGNHNLSSNSESMREFCERITLEVKESFSKMN